MLAPQCPVEPGTLWVFNQGEIDASHNGVYFTGELLSFSFQLLSFS